MRYLLDTHALIWWLSDDAGLNDEAREAVADPGNDVFASTASLWEIGIKFSVGKMTVHPATVLEGIGASAITLLEVGAAHAVAVADLPTVTDHRDPFDRLLVAQAQSEGLVLVTGDRKIAANYDVATLWCERSRP